MVSGERDLNIISDFQNVVDLQIIRYLIWVVAGLAHKSRVMIIALFKLLGLDARRAKSAIG